ncbi:hypothetical protein EW146_g1711 [Bondarzewia mesenterica]|uniref:Leo1-like protein n=1 Tax=Bondarzewia mesenterica TaxID=1095465 RepID=A0A4S4M565_9AGAM|nr:hypothetical protein EW146_g1711 [Bondarzewia mesenterica]
MSSLAGALASPTGPSNTHVSDHYPTESLPLSHVPEDVEMKPVVTTDTNGAPHEDEEMGDLFGEENDVEFVKHEGDLTAPTAPETKSPTPTSPPPPDGLSSSDRKRRQALEYGEEDEPNPIIEHLLEAAVAIPNIPVPRSSDNQHWVIRMPNFVKVDSKPFHSETYIGPEQEDEDLRYGTAAHDRDMGIKLRVENTVRWRWTKDDQGQDHRQSNARIVRWSDGTTSLRLGKEYFDMNQVIDTSGSAPRHAIGGSQPTSQNVPTPTPSATKSQGLTYLVAQHKRAEILQAEALITGYMTLRPTDMQSETHRLLTRRSIPSARSRSLCVRRRRNRVARGEDDGFGVRRRRAPGAGARRRSGEGMVWSDDEEDEAEFEGSDEGEETGVHGAKKRQPQVEGRGRGGEYQTDDFLVADSEEEESGRGSDDEGDHGRRKRRHVDEGAEEDPLDKLESQISQHGFYIIISSCSYATLIYSSPLTLVLYLQ